jgi:3-oxoacyl-[acyl-carrier-protein] synthase II
LLVLESFESARRRGATILAELAGAGLSGDAYRLTDPDPSGAGMRLSMQRALQDAGIGPGDVDHINAHGTSTAMNDAAETRAIHEVLGDRAREIPVSSSKSMIGHPIHGAGAIESVVCVRTVQDGIVHPTLNWSERDPDCDLDYVPDAAREVPVGVVINNSFGFGGQNTTLVIRRADA